MEKIITKDNKKNNLNNSSKILDLGCKKGFIMKDFKFLLPKCKVYGIEDHVYPILNAEQEIKKISKCQSITIFHLKISTLII